MKNAVAVAAILLTFIGYVPYMRDVLAKQTRPHVYSWLIWGLVTLLAFGLQFSGGAGLSSAVLLAAGVVCLAICVLALRMGPPDHQARHRVLRAGIGVSHCLAARRQPVGCRSTGGDC